MSRKDDAAWAEALANAILSIGSNIGNRIQRRRDKEERDAEHAASDARAQESADREAERFRWAQEDRAKKAREEALPTEEESMSDAWWAAKTGGLDKQAVPYVQANYLDPAKGDVRAAYEKAQADYAQLTGQVDKLGLSDTQKTDFLQGVRDGTTPSLFDFLRDDGKNGDAVAKRRKVFDDLKRSDRGMAILSFLRDNPRRTYADRMAGRGPGGGGVPSSADQSIGPPMAPQGDPMQQPPSQQGGAPLADPRVAGVLERARQAEQQGVSMDQGPNAHPVDSMNTGEVAMWYAIAQNPQSPLPLQAAAWSFLARMLPIGGMPEDVARFIHGSGVSEEQIMQAGRQAMYGGNIQPQAFGGQMPRMPLAGAR